MSIRSENAYSNFMKGYNCSQAVMLACTDLTGLDEETALLITSGFGGGIAKTRSVCGTVTGMVMVASMLKGSNNPKDNGAKKEVNDFVQKLINDFKEQNGSTICAELLGIKPMEGDNSEKRKKRPCPLLCKDAVEILEKNLGI